jgi:hypothetical protein
MNVNMQCMYMVQPIVPTGVCGHHRDALADAGRRDIPQPSSARENEDGGSPCPEDGDFLMQG